MQNTLRYGITYLLQVGGCFLFRSQGIIKILTFFLLVNFLRSIIRTILAIKLIMILNQITGDTILKLLTCLSYYARQPVLKRLILALLSSSFKDIKIFIISALIVAWLMVVKNAFLLIPKQAENYLILHVISSFFGGIRWHVFSKAHIMWSYP